MKYPTSAFVLTALAAITLAGCTSTTPGAPGTVTTTVAAPPAASTTSGNAASPLADVDPCSLMDPAIVSQNQLSPGTPRPAPGARTCFWQKSADNSGPGYLAGIDIYDNAGLDQLDTTSSTVTNYPVGNHQGRLSKDQAGGTCRVSIAVTNTSRVDIVGVDGAGRQEQACTVATLVAPSVEKKLPAEEN